MALTRVKKVPTANLVEGSSFLTTASNLAAGKFPAGTVIQTIFGTVAGQVSNTTNTFADTNLTATITPTSASNKILVSVFQNGVYKDGSAAAGCEIRLLRGSTVISSLSKRAGGDNGTGTAATMSVGTVGNQVLDTPSTTSATTYKCQWSAYDSNATLYLNRRGSNLAVGSISTITVMEIKA